MIVKLLMVILLFIENAMGYNLDTQSNNKECEFGEAILQLNKTMIFL